MDVIYITGDKMEEELKKITTGGFTPPKEKQILPTIEWEGKIYRDDWFAPRYKCNYKGCHQGYLNLFDIENERCIKIKGKYYHKECYKKMEQERRGWK